MLLRLFPLFFGSPNFFRGKQHSLSERFENENWLEEFSFISNMYQRLNELNSDVHGENCSLVDIGEKLRL